MLVNVLLLIERREADAFHGGDTSEASIPLRLVECSCVSFKTKVDFTFFAAASHARKETVIVNDKIHGVVANVVNASINRAE
jgi:hypothetical protein